MTTDMIRAQVLAYVEDQPAPVSRDQIAATLKTKLVDTSNALYFWKEQGALWCNYKGRYSTWTAEPPVAARGVNSVFALAGAMA